MKYSTAKDGLNYRLIAEKLSEDGDNITHANVRLTFIGAMQKIARQIVRSTDSNDSVSAAELAESPAFHEAISDIMRTHKL